MQYPKLKIVISHAGTTNGTEEAILLAELCPNVILEPTWCPVAQIEKMIKTIGAERVIMSSDGPHNVAQVISETKCMDLTDAERALYMGESVIKIYGLNVY